MPVRVAAPMPEAPCKIPGTLTSTVAALLISQGRIQDFHWVGAAGPGGAVLAIEGAPLIDQN